MDINTEPYDDDLPKFEAVGVAPLPAANDLGYIENDGARIWYSTYGSGSPVVLLHGGLGHGGNWGVPDCGPGRKRLSCRSHRQPWPWSQHSRRATVFV
jgi:hypothetical protein